MGYSADDTLEDLYPEDFVDEAGRLMAERTQDHLHDRVRHRTPVAQIPEAYGGSRSSWVRDRGGRRPGTLKDSWEKQPVQVRGDIRRAIVDTDDPVARYVENDTRPHLIKASKGGVLRFPVGPFFRFAERVLHPGTEGAHMLRDALADTEVEFPRIGQEVLREMAAAR